VIESVLHEKRDAQGMEFIYNQKDGKHEGGAGGRGCIIKQGRCAANKENDHIQFGFLILHEFFIKSGSDLVQIDISSELERVVVFSYELQIRKIRTHWKFNYVYFTMGRRPSTGSTRTCYRDKNKSAVVFCQFPNIVFSS
jgi:hypothetical protein